MSCALCVVAIGLVNTLLMSRRNQKSQSTPSASTVNGYSSKAEIRTANFELHAQYRMPITISHLALLFSYLVPFLFFVRPCPPLCCWKKLLSLSLLPSPANWQASVKSTSGSSKPVLHPCGHPICFGMFRMGMDGFSVESGSLSLHSDGA